MITFVILIFQTQEDFLPGFERSSSYLRLLAEFDLLGQSNLEEDELSLSSLDTVELGETVSNSSDGQIPNINDILPEKDYLTVKHLDSVQKLGKHARSYSDITDIAAFKTKQDCNTHKSESHQQFDLVLPEEPITKMSEPEEDYSKLKVGNFTLSVDIIEAGSENVFYFSMDRIGTI